VCGRIYHDTSTAELFRTKASLLNSKQFRGTDMINTGRFIMHSVITNIYNKKTKGPTLMKLFTAMLTRVWQELEYRIDMCRVTRRAHIENL
jgi:hypothetical protein